MTITKFRYTPDQRKALVTGLPNPLQVQTIKLVVPNLGLLIGGPLLLPETDTRCYAYAEREDYVADQLECLAEICISAETAPRSGKSEASRVRRLAQLARQLKHALAQ